MCIVCVFIVGFVLQKHCGGLVPHPFLPFAIFRSVAFTSSHHSARCSEEIHNICALVGGVASQEAIKLTIHQFVPLNNTFIFNGIHGVSAVFSD